MLKKIWGFALLLSLVLLLGGAGAETAFQIDVDLLQPDRFNDPVYMAEKLTAATQYIRINCQLENDDTPVKLTVKRLSDGKIVHQKNYGKRSGRFTSDEVYLKYAGGAADYEITLNAGDNQWRFPFYRKLMKLSHNTACTYGVRIREAAPGVTKGWLMATVVDLQAGSLTVPLCASDQYVIGSVEIKIKGDNLSVDIKPLDGIDLTVHKQQLFAITEPGKMTGLGSKELRKHVSFKEGQNLSISQALNNTKYVILYLDMEVSYDPNGLKGFAYESKLASEQLKWWRELEKTTMLEPVG